MTNNSTPRDSTKDAETIELLLERFHDQAHEYASSRDEDEGGHLSIEHVYRSPDGGLYRVQKVVPLWPASLRSLVIFESMDDDTTFVLPLSEWFFQGFKAVLDELDVHGFRAELEGQITTDEDVHRVVMEVRRELGINDAAEYHMPLGLVPALIDMVSSCLGGHRQTLIDAAVCHLRSAETR